jgi:hypothetical protein
LGTPDLCVIMECFLNLTFKQFLVKLSRRAITNVTPEN